MDRLLLLLNTRILILFYSILIIPNCQQTWTYLLQEKFQLSVQNEIIEIIEKSQSRSRIISILRFIQVLVSKKPENSLIKVSISSFHNFES